ncbi:nitrilotriacetate monooxygenase component B [Brucella neotomae]|nr:nitrilotriacetate monooxygenase component B [Brucella neotomae]
MVIGEVIGVHIDDSVLTDGLVDISRAKPVARLGYMDYATTQSVYQMYRPRWKDEG